MSAFEVFEFEVLTIKTITVEFEIKKVFRQAKFETQNTLYWERRAGQARHFVEDLGYGATLEMVEIPRSTFTITVSENIKASSYKQYPQQQDIVEQFFIGKYPITQKQWKTVALFFPQIHKKLNPNPSCFKGDHQPVEGISWYDAVEFCARLSHKTGRNYRLPSEAQWEYACRAGSITAFHFGETITPELANYDCSNYTSNKLFHKKYRRQTTPVGSFSPNAFGLYDMHGNVCEWCMDSFSGSTGKDDPNDSHPRVLRGGSWYSLPTYCRCANRYADDPLSTSSTYGFRLMLSPVSLL